jgi:hypothetical protein
MHVATDEHVVTAMKSVGHPVLVNAAASNVRTWTFADHEPTSFAVTYVYALEDKYKTDRTKSCQVRMELPTQVTVSIGAPWV